MVSDFPSTQSFYGSEVAETFVAVSQKPQDTGDGFTKQEVSAARRPFSGHWVPPHEYQKVAVGSIEPGPHNYEITGRVANFSEITARNGIQPSTEGRYLIVLSDDTGAMAVRLFYIKPADFALIFGSRVTIFATYIAESKKGEPDHLPYIRYCSTIYPGRSRATHIIFHRDLPSSWGDLECRVPPALTNEADFGLMSLKSFLSSGFDLEEGIILVCVRSISPRYTFRSRLKERTVNVVEIGIFDDTATSVLKLWGEHASSADSFVPNQTILMISFPTYKTIERHSKGMSVPSGEIGISYGSMLHVDPTIVEAHFLRKKIEDQSWKEDVLTRFPEGAWVTGILTNESIRELFTIAEVDGSARQDRTRYTIGKLSIIFLEVNLMSMKLKGMLCCTMCCGIPLYANKPLATCKNCGSQRELSLNPGVLGAMVDESGTLMASKLAWKDSAWTQLFFGEPEETLGTDADNAPNLVEQSWEDLTALDTISLKDLEEQLLYSRVSLTFGWNPKLGRLCILGAEW